jgi:hypothetical protein
MTDNGWLRKAALQCLVVLLALACAGRAAVAQHATITEQSPVILACTPTPEAMDACSAAGGHFDSARCRCVKAQVRAAGPCALVCFDGVLDPKACRCVQSPPPVKKCELVCVFGKLDAQRCRCIDNQ